MVHRATTAAAIVTAFLLVPSAARSATPAPERDWRAVAKAEAVSSSPGGAAEIPGLCAEEGRPWRVQEGRRARIELALELGDDEGLIVAIEARNRGDGPVCASLRRGRRPGALKRVDRCMLPITAEATESWLVKREAETARLTLTARPGRGGRLAIELSCKTELDIEVRRLRLFRVAPGQRCDYWLFLGDGLNIAAEPEAFEAELAAAFPGFEPYVVNASRPGMSAEELRKELPGLLERHPYARVIALHIGGFEMARGRTRPAIASAIARPLAKVLKRLGRDGRVPILARHSYRDVKEGAVDHAYAYNEEVFDPLIKRYCPDFFDAGAGRGRVDPYTYFRRHKSFLSYNGVGLRANKHGAWRELWLEAARRIYPSKPERQGPP